MQRELNCIGQAGKDQNSEFQLLFLLVSCWFSTFVKLGCFKLWTVCKEGRGETLGSLKWGKGEERERGEQIPH